MGNKKLSFLCLAVFSLILFSIISVSALETANITVVTPGASGTLSGASAVFNCSVVAGYEAENWTTAYIYLQSASLTANTTETLMATVSNTTAYDFNGTLDSTTVEDGTDYTFKCSLFNGTDYVNATRTGITIDNGVPTAPTISPANYYTISTSGTQTITGTVVDSKTTACTYTIYRGGSASDSASDSGSGSYSGSSCTFTKAFSTSADNGDYWITITASDGTNTTSSSVSHLNVAFPGVGGGSLPLSVSGDGTTGVNSNAWKWAIGIIVVLVIIVGIIVMGKKK